MVKELEARGRHFKTVIEEEGKGYQTGWRMMVNMDVDEESKVRKLSELKTYPEFDEVSIFIRNATNERGEKVEVLLVPEDCPILDKRKEPEYGEVYFVNVWKEDSNMPPFHLLIRDKDINSAKKRGIRIVKRSLDCDSVSAFAAALNPEEFFKKAKELIDRGIKLPSWVFQYGDLSEYIEAKKTRQQKSS